MKRRDFILASGSTVLSGLATSQIQRPAIGLDFEISTPDKDPSEVDSLVIEFETLEITPRYLDENDPVNVQAEVEVDGRIEKSNEVQTSVVNGELKDLASSINSIVVDGLNASSTISGDVTVSIDHPDIQDSYSQRFYVNDSEIPDSDILHQWTISQGSGTTVGDSEQNKDLSFSASSWKSDSGWFGGQAIVGDATDNIATATSIPEVTLNGTYTVAMSARIDDINTLECLWNNRISILDRIGISPYNSVLNAGHWNGDPYEYEDESAYDLSGLESEKITIIYTYDNGSGELYVNNKTDSATFQGTRLGSADDTLAMLADAGGGDEIDANIGHCAVYDKVLSSSERTEYHSAQPHT